MEDSYERQLFKAMAGYVSDKTPKAKQNDETLLIQSVYLSWYLGHTRSFIFENKKINSWESSLIHPVTVDLMSTDGACGSYSFILSSILNELHIPNRIAQMKVNGKYGGHILVEARTARGWVVLDGSYNLIFRKPDGNLASFSDVMNDWNYYKKQAPENYNFNYSYDGVRYTNWDKIPVVLPFVKRVLGMFIGKERIETLSIRTFFLRKFNVLFNITAIIYLTLVIMIIRRFFRKNKTRFAMHLPVFSDKRNPALIPVEPLSKRA
jgi:hypothetical protein